MLPKSDILCVGLELWNMLGETFHTTSKILIIFRIFNGIIFVHVFLYLFLNLFHTEGEILVATIANTTTAAHVLLKYFVFIYYKKEINRLTNERLKFWKPSDFCEKLQKQSNRLFKIVKTTQKLLISSIGILIILYYVKPIFDNVSFTFDGHPITKSLYSEIFALFSLYYFLLIGPVCVTGFDCIYISLCAHLVVQFKLLKCRMQSLGKQEAFVTINRELAICVNYHNFLLRFFARVNKIYSFLFLCQYLLTLATACSQLYLLKTSNNGVDAVKALLALGVIFAQFAIYAIPAEKIVTEIYALPFAIYSSCWYETHIACQRDLLFVMMKGQRQGYLSIGGLVNMNIEAFVSVCRKSFSFYCLLDNILDK